MLSINHNIEPNSFSVLYAGEICGKIEVLGSRVKITYGTMTGYLRSLEDSIAYLRSYSARKRPIMKGRNVTCKENQANACKSHK